MKSPGYLIYALVLLTGATWAEFRGYTLTRVNELHGVPKTIRDNPGSYRSHFGYIPHYTGGK
jgi:hypothetical protein